MIDLGADVGECGAFVGAGRCAGRLLVIEPPDDRGLVVGRCEACGGLAAARVRRETGAAEPERDVADAWWTR